MSSRCSGITLQRSIDSLSLAHLRSVRKYYWYWNVADFYLKRWTRKLSIVSIGVILLQKSVDMLRQQAQNINLWISAVKSERTTSLEHEGISEFQVTCPEFTILNWTSIQELVRALICVAIVAGWIIIKRETILCEGKLKKRLSDARKYKIISD